MRASLRFTLAALAAVGIVTACDGGSIACTEDVECPAGQHCDGATCTSECGGDEDCGDGVTCDTARGRCASSACASDAECDDGVFCNGAETCAGGACAAGAPPCGDGEPCSETAERCGDCEAADADGDGHDAIECGGTDCDDADPLRYPGNAEICDLDHRDEDCDPSTFGVRDADGDTVADAACCNVDVDGVETCGTDCDDTSSGVNPRQAETCDGVDNDCDGAVDEGVIDTFYVDADGDGHGSSAVDAETRTGCFEPEGFSARNDDCDDEDGAVHPGLPDGPPSACNGVDDDCDGMTDPGCSCVEGATMGCGTDVGECTTGIQRCTAAVWGDCTGRGPMTETCNGLDDDCNGSTDELFTCAVGETETCTVVDSTHFPPLTRTCTTAGSRTCSGACAWGACTGAEDCDYCDDDGDGLTDERSLATANRRVFMPFDDCQSRGTAVCSGSYPLLPGAADDEVGGLFASTRITAGYGPIRLASHFTLRASGCTQTGMAIVVYSDSGAATIGPQTSRGVDRGREGVALEQWVGSGAINDTVRLRQLPLGGSGGLLETADARDQIRCDGSIEEVFLTLTIYPFDTVGGTRFEVENGGDIPTSARAGWDIYPGDRLWIGLVGSGDSVELWGNVGIDPRNQCP